MAMLVQVSATGLAESSGSHGHVERKTAAEPNSAGTAEGNE